MTTIANIYWALTLCQALFEALYMNKHIEFFQQSDKAGIIIIPILQISKLKYREVMDGL